MTTQAEAIAATLREQLDAVIPRGARVALLDYPNHENVGDSAIWLGELTYLQERRCEIAYQCDLKSYDAGRLESLPDIDLLLLHGGGNLGDLWQPHQNFRAQVLSDFGDRPIVQLPQTIHFKDDENVEATSRSFSRHPQFTLLVRDQKSLLFAQERLEFPAVLCPDSAYALGKMTRTGSPETPILWLGRTDHEAAERSDDAEFRADGVERADWVGRRSAGPRDSLARAGGELVALAAARFSSLPATVLDGLWGEWERLAWRRVRVGRQILSRGEVVITDRLHAHILCMLLDLPHVVLDNSYGKLSSYAQSWDTLGERALWADSHAEAIAMARNLSRPAA